MNTPTLTPLFWQDTRLVPQGTFEALDASARGTLTILHTNDFHSTIDARPGNVLGGLGWTLLQDLQTQVRPLGFTCADLVWDYLTRLESGAAPELDSRVPQAVVAD